ncbi:MAG: glycosyltransferase family 2 protein [Deltaproteobacteria bacterium]|nr:glycosyltransferase family 2 protein [Deltaproteobacteria bacterium]
MSETPSLSVVVFAYNEAENVGSVLDELNAWLEKNRGDAEIVFVDDGSSDDTGAIAKRILEQRRCQFVRHERNRGIGAALKTGVNTAKSQWVTFMPADGQIEPEAIATLCQAAEAESADVVLSVYDHRADGLDRKILSWGVRTLILLIHGVALRSDGPYLFKRSIFIPEELPPDSFFLNFEFPIRALLAGLKVSTVTIRCRPRRGGISKSTGFRRITAVARDLVDLRARRLRSFIARTLGVE